VPIPGSHAGVAGLSLTAEKMAGRRHRLATVIVRRIDVEPQRAERAAQPAKEHVREH